MPILRRTTSARPCSHLGTISGHHPLAPPTHPLSQRSTLPLAGNATPIDVHLPSTVIYVYALHALVSPGFPPEERQVSLTIPPLLLTSQLTRSIRSDLTDLSEQDWLSMDTLKSKAESMVLDAVKSVKDIVSVQASVPPVPLTWLRGSNIGLRLRS